MTHFEFDQGWNPKASIDLVLNIDKSNKKLSEFKDRLKFTLYKAKFPYKTAQEHQSARSNLKCKSPRYQSVDKQW